VPEPTFPETVTTSRLRLRPYCATEAPQLLALINQNRSRLIESFPNLGHDLVTPEHAEDFIRNRAEDRVQRKFFCYGICLLESGELVGQINIKNIAWNIPSAELSYFIGTRFLRQGFAAEAIGAILDIAFNRLKFVRLFVRVICGNAESLALSRKLGFRNEGIHRNDFRCGYGKLHDVSYAAITDSDYALMRGESRSK
jgi:RimJ/RimL family protein N-acetyltransferase